MTGTSTLWECLALTGLASGLLYLFSRICTGEHIKMKRFGLQIIALLLTAQTALAMPQPLIYGVEAIHIRTTQQTSQNKTNSDYVLDLIPAIRLFSEGIDISIVKPVEFANTFTEKDMARIIPIHEVAGATADTVGAKIFDHTIQSYFESAAVKNSDFGKTASTVEKSMTSNVTWGASEDTKHELKMFMKPTNAKAVVQYSGLANAQVTYAIATAELNFEVSEKITSLGAEIVLSHISAPSEIRDMLNMRWSF